MAAPSRVRDYSELGETDSAARPATYTPALRSVTDDDPYTESAVWTFGNGPRAGAVGRFIAFSGITFFKARFEWGGTGMTTPAGIAAVSLPSAAISTDDVFNLAEGRLSDSSAGALYNIAGNGGDLSGITGISFPTNRFLLEYSDAALVSGTVSEATPWETGPADGDILSLSGWYWTA